jgi:Cu-Zn family superoxide dismutase
MKIIPILAAALPIMAGASACATAAETRAAPTATAKLAAGDGASRGTATVTQAGDGLHVVVRATGLTPGIHAVHIHTTGKCVGPDFTSAGGHWNPTARQHGKDNPAGMHMGDMPNMTVGPDGSGAIEYHVASGSISGGATPLLDADGAAIVVHAQADDNKSDPAGNAGGRVACGVLAAK